MREYTNGFIKIHRAILDWEWYEDANTFRVFMHLLLKANWKDGKFKGVEVKRGSLITSINSLAKELNMTGQSVRTALSHLEKTGEITRKSTNKWQAITIENYGVYQVLDEVPNKQINNQLTINQQSTNNQLTTNKERKKEIKKESKKLVINKESEFGKRIIQFSPDETEEQAEYRIRNNQEFMRRIANESV